MSIKQIKRQETKVVDVVEKTEYFCDKCNKEIKRDFYSRDAFKIKLSRGYMYPEGGTVETEQAYFCEDCAEEIKKILVSCGVVFETVEHDY